MILFHLCDALRSSVHNVPLKGPAPGPASVGYGVQPLSGPGGQRDRDVHLLFLPETALTLSLHLPAPCLQPDLRARQRLAGTPSPGDPAEGWPPGEGDGGPLLAHHLGLGAALHHPAEGTVQKSRLCQGQQQRSKWQLCPTRGRQGECAGLQTLGGVVGAIWGQGVCCLAVMPWGCRSQGSWVFFMAARPF